MFLSVFKGFDKMRKFSIAPTKVQNPPGTGKKNSRDKKENNRNSTEQNSKNDIVNNTENQEKIEEKSKVNEQKSQDLEPKKQILENKIDIIENSKPQNIKDEKIDPKIEKEEEDVDLI